MGGASPLRLSGARMLAHGVFLMCGAHLALGWLHLSLSTKTMPDSAASVWREGREMMDPRRTCRVPISEHESSGSTAFSLSCARPSAVPSWSLYEAELIAWKLDEEREGAGVCQVGRERGWDQNIEFRWHTGLYLSGMPPSLGCHVSSHTFYR